MVPFPQRMKPPSRKLDELLLGNLVEFQLAILVAIEIGEELHTSLSSIQRILTVVEENKTADHLVDIMQEFKLASKKLTQTLDDADKLIQSTHSMVSPDSEFQYELLRMMEEVRKAARSIETLSTTLHEKPEAVIFGKGKQ